MADVKITELPSHGTLTDDDLLIIEQPNGTKKLPLGDVIPDGGTMGQLLSKHSNTDYDMSWEDAPQSLPDGGTTGQVLQKASNTDYDAEWSDAPKSIFWGDDVSSPPAALNADRLNGHPDTFFSPIGNIATIESSPATQAHSVGEYIVYNSQLYKVISAISANDNLIVDTNIEATSVGNELNDTISWKTASSYAQAYANAKTEIMLVGKGKASENAKIAISLIIPKVSIDSTNRYWQNGDSYNGTGYAHLQVQVSVAGASNAGLYYDANIITDAAYEWYYR